jgi:nucleolar protein TMA23
MPGTITNTEESSTATTDSSALSSRADTPATSSNDPSDVSDSAVDVSADKIKKSSKAKKTASLKRKREDERENTGKKQRAGGKAKTLLNLGSIDKEAEVMAGIKREAARIVKEKEDAGEFGPKTPKSKHQREQSARAAKKEAKKTLVVDAMMEGKLPNPKNHTKEEALQNYEKDMKAQKKAAKQQEKAARRGEKRKLKQEVHETPSDVATARAKEEPNAEISRQQAALTKKIAGLTVQERAQYEKRAASKSQSFEQYVLRRIQKKVEKKSE